MSPEARDRRRVRTPVLVVTAFAWIAVLAWHVLPSGSQPSVSATGSHHHAGHVADQVSTHASHGSLPGSLGMWALMLVAMMAPLLIRPLRHVNARTLPRRRWRAMTLFVVAYAAVWMSGGLVLLTVTDALDGGAVAIATAVVAVLVWQVSPVKQRCLNRRHAHPPLAAFGRKADLDALRFGILHGLWCFGSGWALMALPLVFDGAALVVMVIVSAWMWGEQFETPVAARWRLRTPVTALRIVRTSVA